MTVGEISRNVEVLHKAAKLTHRIRQIIARATSAREGQLCHVCCDKAVVYCNVTMLVMIRITE